MAEQTTTQTTSYAVYDDTEKRFVGAPSTKKADAEKTRDDHKATVKATGKDAHSYTIREV